MDLVGSGENSRVDILIDSDTPLNVYLCPKYTRSFAYYTVNIRLPVILTKVIDYLAREKELIVQKHGEVSRDELKEIIGRFSQLKNEIQTNKQFVPLTSSGTDITVWNEYLEEQTCLNGEQRWYSAVWLYAECYMYRRFREMFELSSTLHEFDPFCNQKETALLNSMDSVRALATYLTSVLQQESTGERELKKQFLQLVNIDLWGNSCDLSLSLGEEVQAVNFLNQMDTLKKFVLVDESEKIWSALKSENRSTAGVAIICDNSGYELFADLCLADFLITSSLADHVIFHLKSIPWFVSDVTTHDFHWTLKTLASQPGNLKTLARKWKGYLKSGKWSIEAPMYWTLPFDFNLMQAKDPELYASLARTKLAIFKGDLNYRKLVREMKWRPTKSFNTALGTFHPTNIATLRTVKCDTICGLDRDQADVCDELDADWMRTGNYAVIQFDGVPFEILTGCTAAAYLKMQSS